METYNIDPLNNNEKVGTSMFNINNNLTDIPEIESRHTNVHISAYNVDSKPEVKTAIHKAFSTVLTEKKIKKLKILIAEDDESSAMLQTEIVKKYSSDILYAITGVEAVETCRSNPDIDLIVMDIKIPEMNGHEATRQIRLFNKDIIIIAHTAYVYNSDREKALSAGCNNYIAKPYNQTKMIALIKEYFKES